MTADKKRVEEGKTCALLSYFLIGIIWYFADEKMKKNNFVKFHVRQALLLLIIDIAGYIILSFIPFIGWFMMPLFSLAVFVLAVFGLIGAANGNEKLLPFIGKYAEDMFKSI